MVASWQMTKEVHQEFQQHLPFRLCIMLFIATFAEIISFSLLITISSYVIGDQLILPQIGKKSTVVVDFFLVYFIVWVFVGVLFHSYLMIGWGSIISAILFTGSEVFVHSYIVKNIKQIIQGKTTQLQPKFRF